MATSIYRVQVGDNLTKIAKAHNTTVQELARLNHISNPNRISEGMEIKLCEEQQQSQQSQQSYEELQGQLTETQNQLTQMQNQMNNQATQGETFDTGDMLGLGLGAYGAYKLGEKALPYAWKGAKSATNATVNTGKKLANEIGSTAKHLAKKAELEYAFGKDAVKQGANKVATKVKSGYTSCKNVAKQGAKKAASTAAKASKPIAKGAKVAAKVGGKLISKVAMPVGIAVDAVEVVDIYRKQGAGAAAKSVAKKGACIAAGAVIGSVIPGVGTAVGAGIGWLVSAFV